MIHRPAPITPIPVVSALWTPAQCRAERRVRGIDRLDDRIRHTSAEMLNQTCARRAYARAKQIAWKTDPERCAAQLLRQDAWAAQHPEEL